MMQSSNSKIIKVISIILLAAATLFVVAAFVYGFITFLHH
jgi:hypothetical protein